MREKDETRDIKQENEEKKTFLKGYQEAKRAERRIEAQIKELQRNKLSPGGSPSDGMPRGGGISDLSDYAVKLDNLERQLWRRRNDKLHELKRIQEAIEEIRDEDEKAVLTYKYIENRKWSDIAIEMGYSVRNVHYTHGYALKNLKIPK